MKAVLIVLVLMLPLEAIALPGAAWRGKNVVVRDYTSAEWQPVVAEMVAAFNAALPKRAPRLIYRDLPETACDELPKRRGGIAVCMGDSDEFPYTNYRQRQRSIDGARIEMVDSEFYRDLRNDTCHEFMHALTGIPDDYALPERETSCVHGLLPEPGPFDIAYAKRVYRKYGDHRSGPRDRARH